MENFQKKSYTRMTKKNYFNEESNRKIVKYIRRIKNKTEGKK